MKSISIFLLLFGLSFFSVAQQKDDDIPHPLPDSIVSQFLTEVIIVGNPSAKQQNKQKMLGSIDSYLEASNAVNIIRRGAYAGEAMLNGMSSERSITTIDGMRIFQACTDKMDPVTSYVENTNLSSAKINEGQAGSEHGGTIAGSIDLIRQKSMFNPMRKWGGSVFSGFESNNLQQIYGSALNYSSPKFFMDADFTFRHAKNYKAGYRLGERSEVDFSQFTKYNFSLVSGARLNSQHDLEGSVIYDKATNVGYPGLAMDVASAEAIITSLQHNYQQITEQLHRLETKIYFNTVTHIMDDSHRPNVPIRMDMPGWTKTYGFYSKLSGSKDAHQFKITASGFLNNSLAEMTMYPNQPGEKEMYMLTWPDVNTGYGGIYAEDKITLSHHLKLLITAGLGVQQNDIRSEDGLNSLQLFYPEMTAKNTRFLKNMATQLSYHHRKVLYKIGVGYGERTPTVSEAYGFYLFNINDNYDYIGNPFLKNEKSLNVDGSLTFSTGKIKIKPAFNYFYIMDYIIGKPKEGFAPMNLMATGIKVYEQLSHAHIFNASISADYQPLTHWTFGVNASYRYGQGAKNTILPLIQPFTTRAKVKYENNGYEGEISVEASTKNRNSLEFGETQKPGYFVVNLAFSKDISIKSTHLILKLGVENLFNRYYSTFNDWFGIPRMGRNVYVNVAFTF